VTAQLKTAWAENPAIAVHLVKRFQSQRLVTEVRWQVLNFPHKVINEPDALEILLGSQLPGDVSFQLKVCLYPYMVIITDSNSIYYTGVQ
jgi:phosphatidylinositol 4-kinase